MDEKVLQHIRGELLHRQFGLWKAVKNLAEEASLGIGGGYGRQILDQRVCGATGQLSFERAS